ncbi:flagellin [Sporomusa aerivorans]|uniref:flagellin N-terminal helical domain-containing protein n=1 Tax=Sporomusa aerivorans TaxID=204936 RepID=UPI00352BC85D
MIINHNLASLNTLNVLGRNEKATQSSLAKLSSGLRINSAADDAAGLAISEKMRGQIRGLDQAKTNSQNAISLTQTAEGNLNETSSILQRMQELAVQSANDTATDSNRKEIQKEIVQLKTEIDRISNTAEFNTKKLLNGDVGNTANVMGTNTLAFKPLEVSDSDLAADTYTVKTANAATIGITAGVNTTGIKSDGSEFDMTSGKISGLKLGNYTLSVKSAAGGKFDFALKDKNGNVVASVNGKDNSGDIELVGNGGAKFTIKTGATLQAGEMKFNLNATYATASDFSITNSQGTSTYSSAKDLKITDSDFEAGGIKFEMTVDTALVKDATGTTIKTTNNALTMQIGANANQTMQVAINKIDTKTLGIDGLDLSTKDGAQAAITAIDAATDKVSSERAKLGAVENRLQHTIANLTASSENLTTAESRIRHVDMAAEMASYQKNLVLQQAAQAMLAQANQQPQQVLKLLS